MIGVSALHNIACRLMPRHIASAAAANGFLLSVCISSLWMQLSTYWHQYLNGDTNNLEDTNTNLQQFESVHMGHLGDPCECDVVLA